MNIDEKKKLYAALSAPFPEEAIERTKGSVTGKGYDTASVRAQFLTNRINEVLGLGSYRVHRQVEAKAITTPKGRTIYEAECEMTVELGFWNDEGNFVCFAESCSTGGGQSVTPYDAKKSAHTNAWKRCCAGFGIGKAAWEGALDEDFVPSEFVSDPVQAPVMQRPKAVQTPVAAVAQPQQTPPGYVRTGQAVDTRPAQQTRSRLSSKQLSAIMSISRKLGVEPTALRSRVKTQFGCQLEFISREQASQVIKSLDEQLHGGQPAQEQGEGLAS